jgi:hypothetical protein
MLTSEGPFAARTGCSPRDWRSSGIPRADPSAGTKRQILATLKQSILPTNANLAEVHARHQSNAQE